jgi:hypothetical protein
MVSSSREPVRYYNPNLLIKELQNINCELEEKQIVVIPYATQIYGLNYQKQLKDRDYDLKETKSFNQLTYELWQKD